MSSCLMPLKSGLGFEYLAHRRIRVLSVPPGSSPVRDPQPANATATPGNGRRLNCPRRGVGVLHHDPGGGVAHDGLGTREGG